MKTIQNAQALRKNMTTAEKKLWQKLRDKQLGAKFRRQAPVGEYIVDFLSYDAELIIELDGGQHAMQQSYDQRRTEFLRAQGFEVLRFWNNDVFENMEGVLEIITSNLSHPHPNPPPEGEGKTSLSPSRGRLVGGVNP